MENKSEYLVIKCKKNKVARLPCNAELRFYVCPYTCDCENRGKLTRYYPADVIKTDGVSIEIDAEKGVPVTAASSAPASVSSPAPHETQTSAPSHMQPVSKAASRYGVLPQNGSNTDERDKIFKEALTATPPVDTKSGLSDEPNGGAIAPQASTASEKLSDNDARTMENAGRASVTKPPRWVVVRHSFDSPRAALRFVFDHWLTFEAFSADGQLKSAFLELAEDFNVGSEQKIRNICDQNKDEDVNFKFFRIFYDCIFPERTDFCFSRTPVTDYGQKVIPIFTSREDVWRKLSRGERTAEFVAELAPLLAVFLKLDGANKEFYSEATINIGNSFDSLYVFADRGDRIKGMNWGKITDFVDTLPDPVSALSADREETLRNISFRRKENGYVIVKEPAVKADVKIEGIDDDAMRYLFPDEAASVYGTVWRRHLLFVDYYVNGLERDKLTVKDLTLTRQGFYGELKKIVEHAVKKEGNAIVRFKYVRGLLRFDNGREHDGKTEYGGAIDLFVRHCERNDINDIIRAFNENECSPERIFPLFGNSDGLILRAGGNTQTVTDYIESLEPSSAMGIAIKADRDVERYLQPIMDRYGKEIENEIAELRTLEKKYRECYAYK